MSRRLFIGIMFWLYLDSHFIIKLVQTHQYMCYIYQGNVLTNQGARLSCKLAFVTRTSSTDALGMCRRSATYIYGGTDRGYPTMLELIMFDLIVFVVGFS